MIESKRRVVALIAGLLISAGCLPKLDPVVNTGNAAVAAIDGAIEQITAISGSWQSVLQDTIGKLTSDAQSTVRNEIQTLLQNSIAAVQVGAMCTVDFVGQRVVTALEAIKNKLLGKPAPPPSPLICSSAPSAIEFAAWQQNRVPVVTLTGFDLNVPLQVTHVQTTGRSVVSSALARVSPYQATINLGTTGLRLTPQSQRLEVDTTGSAAVQLSAINVVQPQPPICQESDRTVTPGTVSFVPRSHTRGDREYSGNGPRVTAHVDLFANGTQLGYHVSMTAAETRSDFTTVTGTGNGTLSVNPPLPAGLRIVSISGPTASDALYTDQDNTDDHVAPTNGGPIREFVFVGDTDGDDVGRTRMLSASFHPINLHVVQTINCVTRAEANRLRSDRTITPDLARHLRDVLGDR